MLRTASCPRLWCSTDAYRRCSGKTGTRSNTRSSNDPHFEGSLLNAPSKTVFMETSAACAAHSDAHHLAQPRSGTARRPRAWPAARSPPRPPRPAAPPYPLQGTPPACMHSMYNAPCVGAGTGLPATPALRHPEGHIPCRGCFMVGLPGTLCVVSDSAPAWWSADSQHAASAAPRRR